MQAYEAKIRALVEGSRVVTSKLEVTNAMAPARVIYRSSVDSQSGNNILLLFQRSRVVTSKPEVTNVMAPTRVIYRSSVDS
jgi:hypothetical protein